ncbi:MAG TPA: hypothetical protein VMU82_15030 [Acetobacteraceae bacterium]|nr:hypothetical protein [Acetobacteraceae bacterium]
MRAIADLLPMMPAPDAGAGDAADMIAGGDRIMMELMGIIETSGFQSWTV